jgi:hypothetical protein
MKIEAAAETQRQCAAFRLLRLLRLLPFHLCGTEIKEHPQTLTGKQTGFWARRMDKTQDAASQERARFGTSAKCLPWQGGSPSTPTAARSNSGFVPSFAQ